MHKMNKILGVLICLTFLSGCASMSEVYLPKRDREGKIEFDEEGKEKMELRVRVKQSGSGMMTYKPETDEVVVDTRELSLWQKYAVPVLTGAVESSSAIVDSTQ